MDPQSKNSSQSLKSSKYIKIPALHPKPYFNEIYIKGNRPLAVYIKHSHKVLTKHNTIIIHAMTAAINKAVKLSLHLMEQYPYLQQTIYTDSVPTLNVRSKNKKQQTEEKCQQVINQNTCKAQNNSQDQQIVRQRAAIHIQLTKTIQKQAK